jgi:hypothetical protein
VRSAGVSPKNAATRSQDQTENEEFRAANSLRSALAVIPRQDQSDKEAEHERQSDSSLHAARPGKLLGDDVNCLQQSESTGDICHCPLDQFALPKPLKEFVHFRITPITAGAAFSANG